MKQKVKGGGSEIKCEIVGLPDFMQPQDEEKTVVVNQRPASNLKEMK